MWDVGFVKIPDKKNNFPSRLQSKYHFAADEQSEDSLCGVLYCQSGSSKPMSLCLETTLIAMETGRGLFFYQNLSTRGRKHKA